MGRNEMRWAIVVRGRWPNLVVVWSTSSPSYSTLSLLLWPRTSEGLPGGFPHISTLSILSPSLPNATPNNRRQSPLFQPPLSAQQANLLSQLNSRGKMPPTIYILYNANASLLGKAQYAIKKLRAPADASPCNACDLTHGGLRLNEMAEWTLAKKRIHATVEQLHKDEASEEIREFMVKEEIGYPAVLGRSQAGEGLKKIMGVTELAPVSKDHHAFLRALKSESRAVGIDLSIDGIE